MKKIISVILTLILVFSTCSFVASAAHTTADLETLVSKLPSRYNAYFYNDTTAELLYMALDAADVAFETGDQYDIDVAYALCKQAFDTAYDTEVWYNEHLDDYTTVCINRDESKAIADFYFKTDVEGDTLKPGDTFHLTVSLKTNFYLHVMYTGFIYDWTKFEYVEDSIQIGPELNGKLDINPFTPMARWEYGLDSLDIPVEQIDKTRYPENWDPHFFDTYSLFEAIFGLNVYSDTYLLPTEPIEIYTLTFKVKEDATVGEIGKFFGNYDICATTENYLKGAYDYPVIEFHRGYGPKPFEQETCVGGIIKDAYKCNDAMAYCSQTINFNDEINIRVVADNSLDYTPLDEAIATKENLISTKFSESSWKALEDAVAEGKNGYGAKTQAEIERYAKLITDAINNLEKEIEILSVTPVSTPMVGTDTTLDVLVSKPVSKLRFIDSAGASLTYYPGHSRVLSVVDNADGTQMWRITTNLRRLSEDYEIYTKGKTWSANVYYYTLNDATPEDAGIISYKIADDTEAGGFDTDSIIKTGRHDIIVETGTSVSKVQVAYLGTTTTFYEGNAEVETLVDRKIWKINLNFFKADDGIIYDFYSRKPKEAFKKSAFSAVLDVVS